MSDVGSSSVEPKPALRARAMAEYGRAQAEAGQDQLIVDHLPLVRHVVAKLCGNLKLPQDSEDLVSAGTVGLVRAAKAFDSSHDAEFKTYAYIRIRGAVLDELRSRSFVPTAVHKEIQEVRRAYDRLTARHGQPPRDEELAQETGKSTQELYETMEDARRQHFLSIHGMSEESPTLASLVPAARDDSPESQAERKEMLANLTKAITQLPEKERLVILLYYERELTMKESAMVLGVTESRVSQLHAAALFKLSERLRNAH